MANSPKPITLVAGSTPKSGENAPQPYALVGGLPPATPTIVGGVKRGTAVANATDATTVISRLNDLLAQLRAGGVISG